MEGLLELYQQLTRQIVQLGGMNDALAMLAEMVAETIFKAKGSGGKLSMTEVQEINYCLSQAMSNAGPNQLQQLVKIHGVIAKVLRDMKEADITVVGEIALLICETIKFEDGKEKLAELGSLYRETTEAILKSPDCWGMKDLEWMYKINSRIFRVLRPLLPEMDKNIADLLEAVVDLLQQNGDVRMTSILELNLKLSETLIALLNEENAMALEKLYYANSKLASLMLVYPNKISVQAALLEFTRLVIQYMPPPEDPVNKHQMQLLATVADLMIKTFEKINKEHQASSNDGGSATQTCSGNEKASERVQKRTESTIKPQPLHQLQAGKPPRSTKP